MHRTTLWRKKKRNKKKKKKKKKKHARASTTGGAHYGIEGEQRGGNETEERIYSPAGLAPQGRPFSLFSLVFQAHREDLQPGTNNKSIL